MNSVRIYTCTVFPMDEPLWQLELFPFGHFDPHLNADPELFNRDFETFFKFPAAPAHGRSVYFPKLALIISTAIRNVPPAAIKVPAAALQKYSNYNYCPGSLPLSFPFKSAAHASN